MHQDAHVPELAPSATHAAPALRPSVTQHSRNKATSYAIAGILFLLICSILSPGSAAAATGSFTNQTFLKFTASNGLASQYHVYAAGISPTTPPCVVFQFHGDGAYEFKNPTSSYSLGGANGIVAKSRERGCITVPILTPDKVGSITWWENGSANAVYVRELVAKLVLDYRINTHRVWLVGYSGGSQFITKFYLPLYSSTIKGGAAVVFGGGGVPSRATEKPYATPLTAAFHMHWFTGINDDGRGGSYNALRDARAGEAHYRTRGFATSHEYPANTGHGLSGRFGGIVAQQLRLHDVAASPAPTTSWDEVVVSSRPSLRWPRP
jgi:hypothetical protein